MWWEESDSHTLVLATYEAFTVEMTAFIRFLAAVMREVALSNWKENNSDETRWKTYVCSFKVFNLEFELMFPTFHNPIGFILSPEVKYNF